MLRFTILTAVLLVAATMSRSHAEEPKLKPGAPKISDSILDTNKVPSNTYIIPAAQTANKKFFGVNNPVGFGTEIAFDLKEGQSITINATVKGVKREVTVVLLDPSGKVVDGTDRRLTSAELKVPAVPATGTYRVAIVSPTAGGYTVWAIGPAAEDTKKDLQDKIARLRKELKAAEEALEAMEKKEKDKK